MTAGSWEALSSTARAMPSPSLLSGTSWTATFWTSTALEMVSGCPLITEQTSAPRTPLDPRKGKKRYGQWVFSVYNVYNRLNPYFIYFGNEGAIEEGHLGHSSLSNQLVSHFTFGDLELQVLTSPHGHTRGTQPLLLEVPWQVGVWDSCLSF